MSKFYSFLSLLVIVFYFNVLLTITDVKTTDNEYETIIDIDQLIRNVTSNSKNRPKPRKVQSSEEDTMENESTTKKPFGQEVCSLPPMTGLCRAYFERWAYNKTNRKCKMFVYGGCRGNDNNFETEAQCLKFCKKKTK